MPLTSWKVDSTSHRTDKLTLPPTGSMCSIRNDPHFIDFFAWVFDFHGTGSYKIARNVNEIGVTGEFYQCFPFISCLDTITYRDNPDTVITFDRNHVNKVRNGKRERVDKEGRRKRDDVEKKRWKD